VISSFAVCIKAGAEFVRIILKKESLQYTSSSGIGLALFIHTVALARRVKALA
jgi:hypothetical protein